MTTAVAESAVGAGTARPVDVEQRRTQPVAIWAAIGVGFLLLMLFIVGSWLLSGPQVTDAGPTPIPNWMRWDHYFQEALGVVLWFYLLYRFVIKQWRAAGHITFDGMFYICGALLFWQDALLNYFQYFAVWNAHLVNYGSWYGHVPGWIPPLGKHFIEAPFGSIWYGFGMFIGVLVFNAQMRWVHKRFPNLSNFWVVVSVIPLALPVEMLMELNYTALGFYSYPGGIDSLTLFHGKYYQLPVYECVLWTVCWVAMAAVRYFRDDKGRSVVERGVDEVKVSAKGKRWLSFFALYGVLNVLFIGLYNLPIQPFVLNGSPWPEDVVKRSYYTQGLCGEGTNYACPGGPIPTPRDGGISVGPDGKLHVPPGDAPTLIPFERD